ncbi:DUF4079 domain-containing protein [Oscillatoria sp. FACHB-1406]|uniref:DUF4079 domain-containing protein n=1 Tax=Oscillatoria sp. FACHB-1406 TaxID=2692846 RepID=UPI00168873EC|nr:DUF4079 domain-containing protein [Oscillatoria sp. FACHB-1406]MBD2580563.1 DUF4079 domain-containing protein [Oscillatoria sp. FACHB-1406]
MAYRDLILLLHPIIVIVVVYPLIGIVINRALQVRHRRLQVATEGKSKIQPVVGQEHVKVGGWLAISVFGITLLALANGIFGKIADNQVWSKMPFQVLLIVVLFGVTIAAFFFLHKARHNTWRAIFAILSGMGLVVLGCQDGVYRQTDRWYISHYYYGIVAALLMIISVAIVQTIYKDRSNRWRKVHIILNIAALLLFLGQGITGARSLLEISLNWQEPYVQQLYEQQCETKPCKVEALLTPSSH